jgi:hypothetical protein
MSITLMVQSSVPRLEGKKNYKAWELRIRPLLDSKDERAAGTFMAFLCRRPGMVKCDSLA